MLIFEDFFINFCILFTGVFLIHHYFLSEKGPSKNSIQRPIQGGVLHGLFGVVLMHFGIQLNDGLLIDLRSIPMMVAAYVGGWVSAVTAAAIIIISRLLLYPISFSSLNNIYVLSLSAIVFSFICNLKISSRKKWTFMPVSFMVILGSTFRLVVKDFETRMIIFVQYGLAIAYASLAVYIFKSYLYRTDEHFDKVKTASEKDYLTGLNNVRSFDEKINSLFSTTKKQNSELSLLLIDIDHFKQINDTYGHPAGNVVIHKIAQILLQCCGPVDVVSRNGGEEFSIIMPDYDCQSSKEAAELLRKTVENSTFRISEAVDLQVTVSIGYATTKQCNIISVEDLIDKADQGLYKAKQAGRNRVRKGL
ncbi:GGDEF domain-containing protein [Peribacillus saganii]|uniref:GGDEF domain-containing protein n=1 Tax=Peribacillus saganii TaxID=2303992 RepID=A0A372LAA2_9BACI|nr:GGDEF domain-containing protein [Peribacillus saganii]RFU62600.1 GGDEF domain-containing protein [Peribacillus saganii]